MISALLAFSLLSQFDPNARPQEQLATMSGAMVARCVETESDIVAETQSTGLDEWVFHRFRMSIVISNWGNPLDEKTVGYPQLKAFEPKIRLQSGKLYLIAFGLWSGSWVRIGNSPQSIRIPNDVDAFTPLIERTNFTMLPEGQYTLEGPNVISHFVSILSQAYSHTGNSTYLSVIRQCAPSWSYQDGEVFTSVPGGNAFIAFAREVIIPQIINSAGTDLIKRLQALNTSYRLGDVNRLSALKSQIMLVDTAFSNVNEIVDVDFDRINLSGNQESYLISLLNSRMPSIRRGALASLKKDSSRPIVIEKLSDSDSKMRAVAIKWLNMQDVQGKPSPRWNPDGSCANEAEIIRFWTSPPPR